MSLSPAAAQAKVVQLKRRAERPVGVVHVLPRIGLAFTGDYSGFGSAFRTEGWRKEGSKWFFCGRDWKKDQRQIRLLLAWAKGNGERISRPAIRPAALLLRGPTPSPGHQAHSNNNKEATPTPTTRARLGRH